LKYLLDTNIISELIKKKPDNSVLEFLNNLNENDILLSVITVGEVKYGIENLKNSVKKEELSIWFNDIFFGRFENRIIDIDIEIMLKWGEINSKLKSIGKPLPLMDLIIGSTCIAKNYTLVTRNSKDFKNLDLKIINPFKIEGDLDEIVK